MGKSAKCIEMLQLLKARGCMSREQLAEALQTNIRNLVEYRKELENAGYLIESLTGKYGGYRLLNDAYFPVLKLTLEEQRAMFQAQRYLAVKNDFLLQEEFTSAMDKIRVQMRKQEHDNIYMKTSDQSMQSEVRDWIRMCDDAIQTKTVMEIKYKGIKDNDVQTIRIHPYEVLHYQGAYYCLAYSLKAKAFRNFKFSKERMKGAICLTTTFTRDSDFHVKDHVGTLGLMKDDLHEFEVRIRGQAAILVAENPPGIHPETTWETEDTLYLKTMMEGKINVLSFLLSLGSQVHIIHPQYLKDEICIIAQDLYKNNRR